MPTELPAFGTTVGDELEVQVRVDAFVPLFATAVTGTTLFALRAVGDLGHAKVHGLRTDLGKLGQLLPVPPRQPAFVDVELAVVAGELQQEVPTRSRPDLVERVRRRDAETTFTDLELVQDQGHEPLFL